MSNIRNNNNRIRIHINSSRRKIDQFWDYYSKFLIRCSWLILFISLLITIALTICFFWFMKVRQFDQKDFFLHNSQALRNIQHIQTIFGNDKNFRVHQQIELYPAVDVIIKKQLKTNRRNINEANMLDDRIIQEVG